jgi:hypothetical protein
MRAIIHLGLSGDLFEPPYRLAGFVRKRIRRQLGDQRPAQFRDEHHARNSLPKFHPTRINRLQASQIAAALLFDLGTVDIR